MKKLSEINEGMFSGMVRRSNTDQVKKEDDVNLMDPEQLVKYIKKNYDTVVRGYTFIKNYIMYKEGTVQVPVIPKLGDAFYPYHYLLYDIDHNFIYLPPRVKNDDPEICDVLKQKYEINEDKYTLTIYEKGKTYSDVNNEFFLNVLDTIIENTKINVLTKKNGELSEGMFSGMVRRANTDQVKKEDDINNFDRDELYDYIQKHYKLKKLSWLNMNGFDNNVLIISLLNPDHANYRMNYTFIYKINEYIYTSCDIKDVAKTSYETLSKFFDLTDDRAFVYINPKDGGKINNRFYLKLIDTIIDNIDNTPIQRNEKVK